MGWLSEKGDQGKGRKSGENEKEKSEPVQRVTITQKEQEEGQKKKELKKGAGE